MARGKNISDRLTRVGTDAISVVLGTIVGVSLAGIMGFVPTTPWPNVIGAIGVLLFVGTTRYILED